MLILVILLAKQALQVGLVLQYSALKPGEVGGSDCQCHRRAGEQRQAQQVDEMSRVHRVSGHRVWPGGKQVIGGLLESGAAAPVSVSVTSHQVVLQEAPGHGKEPKRSHGSSSDCLFCRDNCGNDQEGAS